jgi:3-methyladenine DNA glycosylase AlkD
MSARIDVGREHAKLVAELEAAGGPARPATPDNNDSYSSSGLPCHFVSIPELRAMVRAWRRAHRDADAPEIVALADSLFDGRSYEERVLGAVLLQGSARAAGAVGPDLVEAWLGRLRGWALVDSLCASVFSADRLTTDWPAWRRLIGRLSTDADINKRRAALVLLATPTRTSDDPRFRDLAFEVIDRLKSERAILITRAVSWLLRSMAMRHAAEARAYVEANAATLPAIAVRETRVKLATGTKSGRRAMPKAVP